MASVLCTGINPTTIDCTKRRQQGVESAPAGRTKLHPRFYRRLTRECQYTCPNLLFRGISLMDEDDNSRSTFVSITAFCGFGLLLALALAFCSPAVLTWLEVPRARLAQHPHPVPLPTSESATNISSWSDTEIRAALMQCVQSVAGINADVTPIAPIREGECGTPTPIVLSSINLVDKVTFDPPLLTNCPMVVALHRWLNEVVQPAAKEAFGSSCQQNYRLILCVSNSLQRAERSSQSARLRQRG